MPVRTAGRRVVGALLLTINLAACSKLPPPNDVFVDEDAARLTATCLAWQHGAPRQTLTDAARGGTDQKLLGQFLLAPWRDGDAAELRGPYTTLHDAADRLQKGEPGDRVLADAESAMAATDRYFTEHCPTIIAAQASSTTTTS